MPPVLTAGVRVLSPLFLGGADPNRHELRPASIKAALRFWYRAVDPAAVLAKTRGEPREEDRLFGGSAEGTGQSPVLVRVITDREQPKFHWSKLGDLNRFNEGRGTQARNGLKYLSFPFHMGDNKQRTAFDVQTEFKLTFLVRLRNLPNGDALDMTLPRAWLASLWLLGAVGSLGTRSRRGFGSLEITNWSTMTGGPYQNDQAPRWDEAAKRLPDLWQVKDAGAWDAEFRRGIAVLQEWFPQSPNRYQFGHPHFGSELKFRLLPGDQEWAVALNAAGRRLQDFRVRRSPDYENVKRALQTGRPLRQTPDRVAFGMPLTFRYGSLGGRETAQFVPRDPNRRKRLERHASLLRLRLVQIAGRYHPLFLLMSGAIPGRDPQGADLELGRRPENLAPTLGQLLDQFMDELTKG